jgi:hypothetical protein
MSDVVTLGSYKPARTGTAGRAGQEPLAVNERVVFQRKELETILQMYSRLVMAGHCRDYAMGFEKNQATFSAFRHASEGAYYRITKTPALARKQGAWAVLSAHGRILRRGHDLKTVLKVLEKKALRVV